jgi:O-antigen/teichoic acid export membrane protein
MTISILGKILQNSLILIAGRLFSRGMQLFLFIYAARELGVATYGIFSFAYATVTLFAVGMDLGLSPYLVQQLSRAPHRVGTLLSRALRLKAALIPLGLGAMLLAGVVLSREGTAMAALIILGAATALDSITALFNAVFEARQEMKYPALIIAVSNGIMSLTGLALLLHWPDIHLLCLVFALGALLRCAFSYFCFLRITGPPASPAAGGAGGSKMLRNAFPFALVTIFVTIYYYIDTLLLTAFCDAAVVGQYNAAYRLLEAPLFVIQAVTTALFPAASLFFAEDRLQLQRLTVRIFEKAAAFGLSIAVVTALVADDLVTFIYGPQYRAAGPILAVLIFSAALIMPSTICGTTLRATDRQMVSALVTGLGALLNIGLNLALIPTYAAMGAAWATLATEVFVLAVYGTLVWRSVGALFAPSFLLRMALIGTLWVVAMIALRPLGVVGQSAGAVVLLIPVLMAGAVLNADEIRAVIPFKRKPAL